MAYYAIKTLYRISAKGRVTEKKKYHIRESFMIEERVVLFKSKSTKAAIKKAEKEALDYASNTHKNPFGQTVVTEYLGFCDAYELYDDPGDSIEIFSTTDVLQTKATKRKILDMRFGVEDKLTVERRRKLRLKFLNREFLSNVENFIKGKI